MSKTVGNKAFNPKTVFSKYRPEEFDSEMLKKLTEHLDGMRYKKRNKSNGDIYDFLEKLVVNPVPKEEIDSTHSRLLNRMRVFMVNNEYPFTILDDNEGNYYLAMRAIKPKRNE